MTSEEYADMLISKLKRGISTKLPVTYLCEVSNRLQGASSMVTALNKSKDSFYRQYLKMVAGNQYRAFIKTYGWYASGADRNMPNKNVLSFKSPQHINYFRSVFIEVKQALDRMTKPPITITFNKWDTYHAHIFFNRKNKEMGMVFHTKEYPKNYPEAGDQTKDKGNACVRDEKTFPYRNFLWLLSKHSVWVLDGRTSSDIYKHLISDENLKLMIQLGYVKADKQPYTAQERFFGDNIANINYFGDISPNIFLCP